MGWDDAPPDVEPQKESWDSSPPEADIADVPMNALQNVGRLINPVNIARGTADTLKEGAYDLPKDLTQGLAQTVAGAVTGQPQGPNPLSQRVQAISESPQVQHPVNWAMKNPVDAALMAATPLMAFMPPTGASMAGKVGEAMRNKGANLGTELGEVEADTVKKMNPNQLGPEAQENIRMAGKTPNIADVRTETGAKLINDKVVGGFGQDVGDRLQKANDLKNTFGQQVNDSIQAIKKAGGEEGLRVDANPILKSVLDTANELRDSARSGLRQTSRFWRETYNSLASKANANDGNLTLDDIRSELQDVGKDMNAGPNTPRYATAKDIYGHLAEVRDDVVGAIAEKAGNPALAENLIKANKQFSFYDKIAENLRNAAAGGEVPEKMGKHLVRSTMRGDPLHATGYLGLMKLLNSVEPAMAQKLVKYGPVVQKYAGPLEVAAKQGARQLAITNYLIGQKDPEYAAAMQSQ